jgi:hypothetical protein
MEHQPRKHLKPQERLSLVEGRIRAAMDAGEFDNLPGAGQPIADLAENYDELWWVKKLLKRENLSLLPEALEARKEIAAELDVLQNLASSEEVRARVELLNKKIAGLNASACSGPGGGIVPLNLERILSYWESRQRK